MLLSAIHPDDAELGPLRWTWRPYTRGEPSETLARGWLAEQLGLRPQALNLHRDSRGRPRLDAPQADFDCSWSHSGDRLLIALGDRVEVGADCERVHARPRALALAQRFFTPPEHTWLAAQAAGAARDHAFLRLWCAKEAVLKAHGHGLSFGLERLQFAEVEGRLVLTACAASLGLATEWTVHEFEPARGFLAALAWRRRAG